MEIIFDPIPATGPVPLTVLIFAVLLILASQRIEDIMGWDLDTDTTKASPSRQQTADKRQSKSKQTNLSAVE